MEKERRRAILTLIGVAFQAEGRDIDSEEKLKQLVAEYGRRSGVTCEEVAEVLNMKVREVLF